MTLTVPFLALRWGWLLLLPVGLLAVAIILFASIVPICGAMGVPVGALPLLLAGHRIARLQQYRMQTKVRAEVRRGLGWQDTADGVATALRASLPDPAAILPAPLRRGDPAGYQSHLLYAEPDGSFSISAMVWMPGQQTMIHDHVAWCVTGVLQGREYEEIFALADRVTVLRDGRVVALERYPADKAKMQAPAWMTLVFMTLAPMSMRATASVPSPPGLLTPPKSRSPSTSAARRRNKG